MQVDRALMAIHLAGNSTRMLSDHFFGKQLTFHRFSGTGAAQMGGWVMSLTDAQFYHNGVNDLSWLCSQVTYQIGLQMLDMFTVTGGNRSAFLKLSGWTQTDPQDPTYGNSGDWWYRMDAKFATQPAPRNPAEDFAATFAAYIGSTSACYGWQFHTDLGPGADIVPNKVQMVKDWLAKL